MGRQVDSRPSARLGWRVGSVETVSGLLLLFLVTGRKGSWCLLQLRGRTGWGWLLTVSLEILVSHCHLSTVFLWAGHPHSKVECSTILPPCLSQTGVLPLCSSVTQHGVLLAAGGLDVQVLSLNWSW